MYLVKSKELKNNQRFYKNIFFWKNKLFITLLPLISTNLTDEVDVLKGKCQYIQVYKGQRLFSKHKYKYFFRSKSEDKISLVHLLDFPAGPYNFIFGYIKLQNHLISLDQ